MSSSSDDEMSTALVVVKKGSKQKRKKIVESSSSDDSDDETMKRRMAKKAKKKAKQESDDSEDEKPKKKKQSKDSDDEDEKPKKKKKQESDDEDDAPKKKKKKKADDSDEDDTPKKKKKKKSEDEKLVEPTIEDIGNIWQSVSPAKRRELIACAMQKTVASKKSDKSKELVTCNLATVNEEYDGPPIPFMDMFNESCRRNLKLVPTGRVRCWHPDQAMLLNLRSRGNKMHLLDFQEDEDIEQIFVKRVEGKKPPPKGSKEKKWTGSGTFYVNLWSYFDQFWEGEPCKGIYMMTPFGAGAWGMVGPTLETGVEGDRGRVFNGKRKNDSESAVDVAVSTKAYTHLAKDPVTYKNPVMERAVESVKKITRHIGHTTFHIANSLPGWRKEHQENLMDMKIAEQEKYLFKSGCFKGKAEHRENEKDDVIKANVSCFRKLKVKWQNGEKVWAEDPTSVDPPSELFEKLKVDDDGNIILHNRIRVFRARRHDDTEPGLSWQPNVVEVPFENAVISASRDVFAIVYRKNVYEWKQNKADIKHHLVGIIWLNSQEEIKKLMASDVVPCDPQDSIPMAGHYVGLLDRPQGKYGDDDLDEDAMAAAADAAQAASAASSSADYSAFEAKSMD